MPTRLVRTDSTLFRAFLHTLGLGLVLLGAAGCTPETDPETNTENSTDGPRFTATIPPLAMIARPVVDGRARVTTLLEPGDSPHTYEPRPSDLRAVRNSDALLFGAPVLDGWAADLPADRAWALLDMVPPSHRRSLPAGHRHDAGDAPSVEVSAPSTDPHFWTDPQAVQALLPALVDSLCAVDAAGCEVYRANADTFATTLRQLDERARTQLQPVRHTPVMLSQPFFLYFMHRYGPDPVAVIEPIPGKEPSARRIERLVRRAETDSVQAIFSQRQLPIRSTEAVAEAAEVPVHALDPLGGRGDRTTYSTLVLHNVEVVWEAVSER